MQNALKKDGPLPHHQTNPRDGIWEAGAGAYQFITFVEHVLWSNEPSFGAEVPLLSPRQRVTWEYRASDSSLGKHPYFPDWHNSLFWYPLENLNFHYKWSIMLFLRFSLQEVRPSPYANNNPPRIHHLEKVDTPTLGLSLKRCHRVKWGHPLSLRGLWVWPGGHAGELSQLSGTSHGAGENRRHQNCFRQAKQTVSSARSKQQNFKCTRWPQMPAKCDVDRKTRL